VGRYFDADREPTDVCERCWDACPNDKLVEMRDDETNARIYVCPFCEEEMEEEQS
jgi:flavoprotein